MGKKTILENRRGKTEVIKKICNLTGYDKDVVNTVFDALKFVVLEELRDGNVTVVPNICSVSTRQRDNCKTVSCRAFQQITHIVNKEEAEIETAVQLFNLRELRNLKNKELLNLKARLSKARKNIKELEAEIEDKTLIRNELSDEIKRVDLDIRQQDFYDRAFKK